MKRLIIGILQNRFVLTALFLFFDCLVLFEIYTLTSAFWALAFDTKNAAYLPTLLVMLGTTPIAFFLLDRYAPDITTELELFRQHLIANMLALFLSAIVLYLFVTYHFTVQPSRAILVITFMAFAPASFLYRMLLSSAIARQKSKDKFIVLGTGELAREFYKDYARAHTQQKLVFVHIDEQAPAPETFGKEGEAKVEPDLESALAKIDIDHDGVIIAEHLSEMDQSLLLNLIKLRFQKTAVYTLETFSEKYWKQVPLQTMNRLWPLQSGFHLSHGSLSVHFKRLIDIVVSFFGLLFLSPFLAFVGLLVCIESRGPAIFKQVRIGKDAKPFTMYKFRTMTVNSDKGDLYTRKGDSRITRLGGILRLLRIDELPQLFNVFMGDMSLIGPRAEWNKLVEQYERSIPDYHFRHLVKPGITGWAQICYPYGENEEDTKEKLKYDLYYVRHFSTLLDFAIALKTFKVMFLGKGR